MGTAADDVTIGEVMRALEAFRKDVRDDFAAVNVRFDNLDVVPTGVYAADKLTSEERFQRLRDELQVERVRVDRLEASQQWLLRTIGAAVIVAIVGAIFAASRFGG